MSGENAGVISPGVPTRLHSSGGLSGRTTVTLYVSVPCAEATVTSISVPLASDGIVGVSETIV